MVDLARGHGNVPGVSGVWEDRCHSRAGSFPKLQESAPLEIPALEELREYLCLKHLLLAVKVYVTFPSFFFSLFSSL